MKTSTLTPDQTLKGYFHAHPLAAGFALRILLAQIYQCQDQLEESERYYLEACAIAEEIGEPQQLFPCYGGLATLYPARGDTVKAEAYLAKGLEICQKTGYSPDTLIMLPFLC